MLALTLAARLSAAQVVRGVVVDGAAQPVPGVAVMLIDGDARAVARALSSDSGTFRFRAVPPGRYRLTTLRIGYAPTTGQTFNVDATDEVVQRVVLSGVQIRLDTMRVVGQGVCKTQRDSAAATFAVWDQARAALTAAQLTGAERTLRATTVRYERYFDANQRTLRGQRVLMHVDSAGEPWQSLSPDSLHRAGYVATSLNDSSTTFFAPSIEALLSDVFAEDHCFHLQASDDASRVGLAFEPVSSRRALIELRGTLWLDRQTAELRELEYSYANLTPARVAEVAGGSMKFARAAKAGWVISGWNIRLPMLSAPPNAVTLRGAAAALREAPRVSGVKVTGGELAVMQADGDTIWQHAPVSLTVAVIDSATNAPVPGAVVSLDESAAEFQTDGAGRARLDSLRVGNRTLRVHTPALDSLGVATQLRISILDSAMTLTVRTPSPRQIQARGGTFVGRVIARDKRTPVIAAEVLVPDLGMSTRTDGTGTFRLEHVAAGPHEVTVRRIGYAPATASVPFQANREVNRVFSLDAVVTLDSVVVEDRSTARAMELFEEHRRMGIGHFLTRDSLASYEGRPMSNILDQVQGLRLRKIGSKAIVTSTHKGPVGCAVPVYLDHMLIYRGAETTDQPFDVNSLSPSQVEAIEFYSGPAQTPAEYQGLNTACGVLVIWTRRTP